MTDTDPATIDREMAYCGWEYSCRTPHPDIDDILCRRPGTHVDDHASGFGTTRIWWANTGYPRFEFPIFPIVQRGELSVDSLD